jgi:hypothetical protein
VATVATTIADLHDIGVAIGAVSLDSVVVTPGGHAVLTDVTHAARLAGKAAQWSQHPRARRDDRELGRLLDELLDTCVPSTVADLFDTPHRWAGVLRRRATPGATVRRLGERAAGGAVASRQLAQALAEDVPRACLPRRVGSHEPTERAATAAPSDEALDRWFDAPQPATLAGAGGAPATSAGAGGAPATCAGVAVAHRLLRLRWPLLLAAASIGVMLLVGGRPSAASPSLKCAPPGTACPSYRAGVLSINGTQYAVGAPGDVAVTGRWSCGAALLALLRPASGDVWLYGGWPTGAASLTPKAAAVVVGARRLVVLPGHRCDTLEVVRRDGTQLRVPPGDGP